MKPIEISQFSIIIPTYQRGRIALDTIKTLEQQSERGFQVIVVDQSEEIYAELQNFDSQNFFYKYVHIEIPGLPNARNIGVSHVQTDHVIFLDDDCIPHSNLVKAYADIFSSIEPDIALIGGRVIEKGSNIFKERISLVGGYVTRYGKTLKNFDTDQQGFCEWVPGGNFCVRASVFRQVGGFDTNFIGTAVMEDSDFGYAVRQQGYRVLYSPEAIMEHLRIPTGGLRQSNPARGMLYRAHNSVYFFRKYGLRRYLPVVKMYLVAVALKDWLAGQHGISALCHCCKGFVKGLGTPLPNQKRS